MHHYTPVYAVLGMKPREPTHARQVLYQLNHTPSLRLSLSSWISCLFEAFLPGLVLRLSLLVIALSCPFMNVIKQQCKETTALLVMSGH